MLILNISGLLSSDNQPLHTIPAQRSNFYQKLPPPCGFPTVEFTTVARSSPAAPRSSAWCLSPRRRAYRCRWRYPEYPPALPCIRTPAARHLRFLSWPPPPPSPRAAHPVSTKLPASNEAGRQLAAASERLRHPQHPSAAGNVETKKSPWTEALGDGHQGRGWLLQGRGSDRPLAPPVVLFWFPFSHLRGAVDDSFRS